METSWILTAVGSFAAAAFLTSITAIVKLTFQHGGTLKSLENLIVAVNSLGERVEKLAENHGERINKNDLALARADERMGDLERRMAFLEAIVRGRMIAQDDLEKKG